MPGVCYLLYVYFYLKLAISCKNLFLSLFVVRLVIFLIYEVYGPLSTETQMKNSYDLCNPPKNSPKIQCSVLNQAENVSMTPYYHPRMSQWLHNNNNNNNFLSIDIIYCSQISSLSALMDPEYYPCRRQWSQIAIQ